MKKKIILLFYLRILIKNCLSFNPPENLRNIDKIYTSSYNIYKYKPVITHENVYFVENRKLQGFKYINIDVLSGPYITFPYGNSIIIPLLQDTAIDHFYTFFFHKDCTLRAYSEDPDHVENTCKNLMFEMNFDELENNDNCYGTLKIHYDHLTHYMAVYNTNSNKIIVFDTYSAYLYKNKKSIIEVEMKGKVKQAFIYSKGKTNELESVLIGIDENGQIDFWNIQNYCNMFSSFINYAFYSNLITSFETKKFIPFQNQDIAALIRKNTLLYVNNDNFHLYDVDKLKHISSQNNLINGVSALLSLKDGNALVGTEEGDLYLIALKNNLIEILDKIKLCKNKIYFLSSIENCASDTELCYKIAANCVNLIILELFKSKNKSNKIIKYLKKIFSFIFNIKIISYLFKLIKTFKF